LTDEELNYLTQNKEMPLFYDLSGIAIALSDYIKHYKLHKVELLQCYANDLTFFTK